jgi:hypothetical protein
MKVCDYLKIVSTKEGATYICGYKPLIGMGHEEDIVCDFKGEELVYIPVVRGLSAFYFKCKLPEDMGDEIE